MFIACILTTRQIAQDDEGFDLDIASVRSSLDFDVDDLDHNGNLAPPAYDAPPRSRANNDRDTSPLPAPTPKRPASLPRESLDGETIFAVGGEEEDDDDDDDEELGDSKTRATSSKGRDWSDESGDEEERAGLTGKKS